MVKAPVKGKYTVTQGPHDLVVNGRLIQKQLALDLSPRLPWATSYNIYAPVVGKVFKTDNGDGFYLVGENGYTYNFVHCKMWSRIKNGWKTKQGGKIGGLVIRPGMHLHFYILVTKNKRAVGIISHYEKYGVDPNTFIRDPQGLCK